MADEKKPDLKSATTGDLIDEWETRLRKTNNPTDRQLAHHLQEIKGMMSKDVLDYRGRDDSPGIKGYIFQNMFNDDDGS